MWSAVITCRKSADKIGADVGIANIYIYIYIYIYEENLIFITPAAALRWLVNDTTYFGVYLYSSFYVGAIVHFIARKSTLFVDCAFFSSLYAY